MSAWAIFHDAGSLLDDTIIRELETRSGHRICQD
jgi:hypothetical protein